jgi:hypothetical protein
MQSLSLNLFRSLMVAFCLLSMLAGTFTAKAMLNTNLAQSVNAQTVDPRDELIKSGQSIGHDVEKEDIRDIRYIVAGIIRYALTFVGTILTILIMYAGYLWWSARGNDDQVTKAKSTLKNAVIGIIIIMMSYGLVTLLFRSI